MKTDSTTTPGATPSQSAIEERVIQFAEQLGYVVGTIQAKSEGWLDPEALRTQLTSVRNAATDLLKQVTPVRTARPKRKAKGARPSAKKAAAKPRGPVDAPGKRHRKPAPTAHGLKKSDERIAKLRTANANRQRRKY